MSRWLTFGTLGLVLFCTAGCPRNDTSAPPAAASAFTLPAPGAFAPAAITLRELPDRNLFALVDEKLVFVDAAGREWTAPNGTLTDGASVPGIALVITDGRFNATFLKAAIVHDAWCQGFNKDVCPDQYRKRPWPEVHRMFHEAMLTGGTPRTLAFVMFNAVWLGGPRWDDAEQPLAGLPTEERRTELLAELEASRAWIEQEPRSIAEIDRWVLERERQFRVRHDLVVPAMVERLPPRTIEPHITEVRPELLPHFIEPAVVAPLVNVPDIDLRLLDPSVIDPRGDPEVIDPDRIDRRELRPPGGGPG